MSGKRTGNQWIGEGHPGGAHRFGASAGAVGIDGVTRYNYSYRDQSDPFSRGRILRDGDRKHLFFHAFFDPNPAGKFRFQRSRRFSRRPPPDGTRTPATRPCGMPAAAHRRRPRALGPRHANRQFLPARERPSTAVRPRLPPPPVATGPQPPLRCLAPTSRRATLDIQDCSYIQLHHGPHPRPRRQEPSPAPRTRPSRRPRSAPRGPRAAKPSRADRRRRTAAHAPRRRTHPGRLRPRAPGRRPLNTRAGRHRPPGSPSPPPPMTGRRGTRASGLRRSRSFTRPPRDGA